MKLLYMMLGASLLVLGACKDEENEPIYSLDPENITIISPTENTEFNHGDTIPIQLNVANAFDIHEYLLDIRNEDEGFEAFTIGEHRHWPVLEIDTFCIAKAHMPSTYSLTFQTLDHNNLLTEKRIQFTVKP